MIKKFDEPDSITPKIYAQAKACLQHLGGTIDKMPPSQKKYFQDMHEFCDLYDFGKVRHWWEFFNTSDDLVRKYDSQGNKEVGRTVVEGSPSQR